jgi:RNA polymerase primary sigma factor
MADQDVLRELTDDTLHALPEHESAALRLRFGLVDGRLSTAAEIEHATGVTPAQMRQIEAKALRHLRSPARRGQTLRAFLQPDHEAG